MRIPFLRYRLRYLLRFLILIVWLPIIFLVGGIEAVLDEVSDTVPCWWRIINGKALKN